MTVRIGRMMVASIAIAVLAAGCTPAQDEAPVEGQQIAPQTEQEMFAESDRIRAEYGNAPDSTGSGPYQAAMEIDPGLPGYVIYHPADMSALGAGKLGVVVWGNGGCSDDGSSARHELAEIASHGYLAIAPGEWRSGPNAKSEPSERRAMPKEGEPPLPPRTTSAQLTAALDWALAENARDGSAYQGKIDEDALAFAGYSCGGVQALSIADDPRISALVVQNSGLFPEGAPAPGGMNTPKSVLKNIHTPVLYLSGGPRDIAYPNAVDDWSRLPTVPAAFVNIPTGHLGTYHMPNGGKAASIVVDWLEWNLRGDEEAAKAFKGEDCTLCEDPEATIEVKNLPS